MLVGLVTYYTLLPLYNIVSPSLYTPVTIITPSFERTIQCHFLGWHGLCIRRYLAGGARSWLGRLWGLRGAAVHNTSDKDHLAFLQNMNSRGKELETKGLDENAEGGGRARVEVFFLSFYFREC